MDLSESLRALLVTVNFKSASSTLKLLSSLTSQNSLPSMAVIIVDNGSDEDNISPLSVAADRHSNIELLVSDGNLGYFGGAKIGLDHYLEQGHELPEWIIVCNPDIVIDDLEFISKLSSEHWQELGVIAPRIRLKGSAVDQNPFMLRRPGRLRMASLRAIYSNYPVAALWDWLSRKKRFLQRRRKTHGAEGGLARHAIYAPHGSFLIFSRRFFEAGGFLDDGMFLYGEEISVAEICRSLRLPIVFEPQLEVWHDEHATTGQAITRTSYRRQKHALEYVFSRYFSAKENMAACPKPEVKIQTVTSDAD